MVIDLNRMGHRILRGGSALVGGNPDPLGVYTYLIRDPRIEIALVREKLDLIGSSSAISEFLGICLGCHINSDMLKRLCHANFLHGVLKWAYGCILRDFEIRCYVHSWMNIVFGG